jgi:hypothetical protein
MKTSEQNTMTLEMEGRVKAGETFNSAQAVQLGKGGGVGRDTCSDC